MFSIVNWGYFALNSLFDFTVQMNLLNYLENLCDCLSEYKLGMSLYMQCTALKYKMKYKISNPLLHNLTN